MSKSILVVDDETAIREMLRYALELAGFNVSEAGDSRQAEKIIAEHIPDLILLDWMLPGQSGMEFAKHLKQQAISRDIPIIMLTAKAEEDHKVKALETGADDYVIKPFSPRELVARIKAVMRRGPLETPAGIIHIHGLQINDDKQQVTIDSKPIKLSKMEYRLLYFLVRHQGRTYARQQLLNHVWGPSVYIDERTVDVQIKRLRKALRHPEYAGMIQTVRSVGYRFASDI
jgi:two-component system phosphate regulon response regulator PhoB